MSLTGKYSGAAQAEESRKKTIEHKKKTLLAAEFDILNFQFILTVCIERAAGIRIYITHQDGIEPPDSVP